MKVFYCDRCGKRQDDVTCEKIDGKWYDFCDDCENEFKKLVGGIEEEYRGRFRKWFQPQSIKQ